MQPYNFPDVQSCELGCLDRCFYWDQVDHRHKSTEYDPHVVVPVAWGKRPHEVHSDRPPWSCRDGQAVKQAQRLLVVGFSCLAGWTGVAVLIDCSAKLGPPIPSADIVCCPLCSQVSECLMRLSGDHGNDRVTLYFCMGYAEDLLSTSIVGVHEVIPQLKRGVVLRVGPYL